MNEHTNDDEALLERVRMLLAIAQDPGASDNEQHIALERAQRLMDRHAIEMWRVERGTGTREPITERHIRLKGSPVNEAMAILAETVALGNRCRASHKWYKAPNGRIVITGVTFVAHPARRRRRISEAAWRRGIDDGSRQPIGLTEMTTEARRTIGKDDRL